MTFLSFDEIKKSFGKNVVLKDITLRLNQGEIFGFVGKSGGGKSTLLNILTGIMKPDSGKIFFEGKRIGRNNKYLKKHIGFVSQYDSLFPEMTLKENCYYFGRLYGVKRKLMEKRFLELARLLDLAPFIHKKISTYSGGMVKRANILISLIHYPQLLILDEPTVGLDSILRDSLWEYIRKLNKKENITIFLVTHLLEEIEDNCNRAGILKNGEIVAVATLEQYKQRFGNVEFKKIFAEIMKNEDI